MNIHHLPPPEAQVPHWRLDPEAMYRIDGRDCRLLESDDRVHSFQETAKPREVISLSQMDFYRKHGTGEAEIEPRFLSRQRAYLRTLNKDFLVSDLAPKEQERVLFAYLLCQGFDKYLGEKQQGLRSEKINLGKPCLTWLLSKIQEEIVTAHNVGARKGNALRFSGQLPSARQFARDWRKYEACRAPAAFARLYRGSSTRRKNSNPLELRIRHRIQLAYASPKRPTEAAVLKRYQGLIRRLNRGLKASGQMPLKAVSRKTFAKGIKALDPFHVTVMREGEKAALARFGTGSGGFGNFRPLERLEFDEWKIDLQTLLVELDVWQKMTPLERAAVERSRLWVTVAMDTATRCVPGFKIHHRKPCGDTAVDVLELALTDKSGIADYIGAGCSYPYSGKVKSVLPDNGSAFRSTAFLVAANDAGAELLLPLAGAPRARAHLERAFRTFSNQALHWFRGRTFSDIVTKGDADPQAEANVCADAFAKGFFRYLIDEYHHTPHSGLGGETPHDAWMRLTKKYPVEPGPDLRRMRRIFGLEFRRKVDNLGIRFLGFQYNSRGVQSHYGKEVVFRVSRYDVSRITFWNGVKWEDVDPMLPIPQGLTVYELEHAQREFAARFADRKEMHLDFVADSTNALRALGESLDRAAVVSPFADRASERARLDHLDRERFGFTIRQRNAGRTETENPRLLDLTKPRATPEDGATFDLPPGWRDSPAKADPERYDFRDEDVGEAEEIKGPVTTASSDLGDHDDADDIGFE